jgi:hypothetical protein
VATTQTGGAPENLVGRRTVPVSVVIGQDHSIASKPIGCAALADHVAR